jgi:hypothetical protein
MGQTITQTVTTPQTGPTAPPAADPNRPAYLPEKFKTAEDLAKAYVELEKKLGTTATPPADDKAVTPPATPPANQPPAADLSKFEKELGESGKLSDASYAELEKLGYPKATVDAHIAGQQAIASQLAQQVFTVVGGQDKLQQMMQWAQGTFSPAEQNAFNEAMQSGDVTKAKQAATALQARYTAAYGKAPTLFGGKAAAAGPAPFQNWAQVSEAMGNPKYASDPAYRASVEQRMAVSNI